MAKFADRLQEARDAALSESDKAAAKLQTVQNDRFSRTAKQLLALVDAELDVEDTPRVEFIHKPYSHGSPESDYAVVKFDDFWFGLEVPASDSTAPEDNTRLLGIIHCLNGHIQDFEYPTSAEDSWQKSLLRLEAKTASYTTLTGCATCIQELRTARDYQSKLIQN